ncbi:DUF3303 family protein [Actinospica robiniae]|uniref:DUF3303 family protein n=1 Tax=Actinospica robiniae TaxID=304901 RepID=UPI000425B06F|nr:DUF3303 family protein [Actinospica robiniae]
MRVLMTVQMDTEKANKAIADKSLPQIMQSVLEQIKPEAVYFGALEGRRTAYIVFDLEDAAGIPAVAEPFFQHLHAKVDFVPVMDFKDVQAGLAKLG